MFVILQTMRESMLKTAVRKDKTLGSETSARLANCVCGALAAGFFNRSSESGQVFTFHFCPNCGTTLYRQTELKPGVAAVAADTFADPCLPAPPRAHFEQHRGLRLHHSL